MSKRTKTLGVAAAFAAIALSIPTAIAYGDPEPTPAPIVVDIPDPQGSGCDAMKALLPAGSTNFDGFATQPASVALSGIPGLSTFSAAINGGLNPAVNIASVLDNGPYVVFAPTDEAFAALPPEQLEALKADPAALTSVLFYHMALGYLGPDDVHGKLTSQQGSLITVTGKGGDIKVDDVAKTVCAGITSKNAKIYVIDTVLDPAKSLGATATTTTSATETTATSSETTSTETSSTETSSTESPTESAAAEAPAEVPAG